MLRNLFKIKKISDLTRLCVLPVMILSIFLSFYLYVDMEKIRDKSQELVDNAIPHVLSTQQRAINFVHLKRNIELMTSLPDLQQARKYYVDVRALLTEQKFKDKAYLKKKGDHILSEINRLWKLRLQLDELRSAVHSSLHFMDSIMYLMYNENPMLYPELDSHVGNYIDLYKVNFYSRDLKQDHEELLKLLKERVYALQEAAKAVNKKDSSFDAQSNREKRDKIAMEIAKRKNAISDDNIFKQDQIEFAPSNYKPHVAQALQDYNTLKQQQKQKNLEDAGVKQNEALKDNGSPNIQHAYNDHFGDFEHDLKLLRIYEQELERFTPLWELFIKLQHVFVYDAVTLQKEVDELTRSFTLGETTLLHEELNEISQLASETKPMVMVTIAFCLASFWLVMFLLNRFIMMPLKNIARILIRFRHTKKINKAYYEHFFAQEHLIEIREIIDILPHIFDEFSSMEQNRSALKMRYDKLLANSKIDALTKAYNRGSLNNLIKALGPNTPTNFAVLMLDIDFFKKLNDSMGHQRGDEVLFAVAQTIKSSISHKDMVFRYGGEEFCVILTDITEENAYKVACRLCATIRELKLINEGIESKCVTISVGLSLINHTLGQFRVEELISQADKALYRAKQEGRDRVYACTKEMIFDDKDDNHQGKGGSTLGENTNFYQNQQNQQDLSLGLMDISFATRSKNQDLSHPAVLQRDATLSSYNLQDTDSFKPDIGINIEQSKLQSTSSVRLINHSNELKQDKSEQSQRIIALQEQASSLEQVVLSSKKQRLAEENLAKDEALLQEQKLSQAVDQAVTEVLCEELHNPKHHGDLIEEAIEAKLAQNIASKLGVNSNKTDLSDAIASKNVEESVNSNDTNHAIDQEQDLAKKTLKDSSIYEQNTVVNTGNSQELSEDTQELLEEQEKIDKQEKQEQVVASAELVIKEGGIVYIEESELGTKTEVLAHNDTSKIDSSLGKTSPKSSLLTEEKHSSSDIASVLSEFTQETREELPENTENSETEQNTSQNKDDELTLEEEIARAKMLQSKSMQQSYEESLERFKQKDFCNIGLEAKEIENDAIACLIDPGTFTPFGSNNYPKDDELADSQPEGLSSFHYKVDLFAEEKERNIRRELAEQEQADRALHDKANYAVNDVSLMDIFRPSFNRLVSGIKERHDETIAATMHHLKKEEPSVRDFYSNPNEFHVHSAAKIQTSEQALLAKVTQKESLEDGFDALEAFAKKHNLDSHDFKK